MDSYQASLGVSRQTTGWSFVTSVCIHALLLCALLLSYHVQSVLLTRQLKQAVPTAQGLDRSTVIFKNPQAQSGTAQNQSAAQQQQANAASSNHTQATADAAAEPTPSNAQDKPSTPPQTTLVSKQDFDQEQIAIRSEADQKITKPATSHDTMLELPMAQETDSLPITSASASQVKKPNQITRSRSAMPLSGEQPKTPWYRSSATRSYPEASTAKPEQKNIRLQDITRGFLKSVQQEKRKAVQENNQLSTHDMVSKSYETKVYTILQKSVLVEAKPIAMNQALSTVAEIVLTIDKKGAIVSFEFNHPLPKQALKAVEDQLRRAAYSTGLYPSFPRIFTQNTYRFSLPLHIEITKGQHSYRLTTNYRPL